MLREPNHSPRVPERYRQTGLQEKRTLAVLLIDDSRDDQVLFQAAFQRAGSPVEWKALESAAAGVAYLESLLGKQGQVLPDVVVVDSNMPGENGPAVLEFMRREERLARLPVVVITGLMTSRLRTEAMALGADLVLEKPMDSKGLVSMANSIYERYAGVAAVGQK